MERIVVLSNSVGRHIDHNVKATAVRTNNYFEVISLLTSHKCDYIDLVLKVSKITSHIFVDLEKKQPLDATTKSNQAGNLYKRVLEAIDKLGLQDRLILHPIKLNDLTVSATWSLLNHTYRDISGLSLGLVGMGNIGSKLALSLTECGVHLKCFNRDKYKALHVVNSIFLTKPFHTIVTPDLVTSLAHTFVNTSGIILACSELSEDISQYISLVKGRFSVFLIGHSLLKTNSLEAFQENSIHIQRVDIGSQLLSYVHGTLNTYSHDIYGTSPSLDTNLCSGGYLGKSGELIVDNHQSPNWLYGVADGLGGINYDYRKNDISGLSEIDQLFN